MATRFTINPNIRPGRSVKSFFYRLFLRVRWFAITPIVLFGLINAYLAVVPADQEEVRIPEPVVRVSGLDDLDLEEEARREAKRIGSRPLVVQFGPQFSQPV